MYSISVGRASFEETDKVPFQSHVHLERLYKDCGTPDWGLDEGLTTLHYKKTAY
jgi:hypothetical protein